MSGFLVSASAVIRQILVANFGEIAAADDNQQDGSAMNWRAAADWENGEASLCPLGCW
jgi:hypothetical protein